MGSLAEERRYRQQRAKPVHLNNSVRRTYDLIRAMLRTLEPETSCPSAS